MIGIKRLVLTELRCPRLIDMFVRFRDVKRCLVVVVLGLLQQRTNGAGGSLRHCTQHRCAVRPIRGGGRTTNSLVTMLVQKGMLPKGH